MLMSGYWRAHEVFEQVVVMFSWNSNSAEFSGIAVHLPAGCFTVLAPLAYTETEVTNLT